MTMFEFSENSVSQHAAPCGPISSKAVSKCHKRKADQLMPNSAYAWNILDEDCENHWATATYITVIWGHSFEHILEAMVVGMALKRTSTRRRICFVNDVPFAMLLMLNTIWEIREFEHLDMSSMKKMGASKRLSNVYSKLQAWSWLSGEAEVAIMLDTNLFIKLSLDPAFYNRSHCKVAGSNRGKSDFRLDRPRPVKSIKTKENKDRGLHGGGINGGVMVFTPNQEEFRNMWFALKEYEPPDNSKGEQDFISQYFGLREEIGTLDIAFNFQVHQLALTAARDDEEGRWISLANRQDQISCYHFTAEPKPSALLLGDIDKTNCGWMWKEFCEHAEWYNDDRQDLKERGKLMASVIYDYHAGRSSRWTGS